MMIKHCRTRFSSVLIFSVVVALFLMSATEKQVSTVHAQGDSLVAVAVDATSMSHCMETDVDGIGTAHPVTRHYPCPVGTIVQSALVPLSQVVTQHEQYIPLSSGTSQTRNAQIQHLMQNKGRTFSVFTPNTGCGQTNTHQVTWSNYDTGDHITYRLTSQVKFTLSPTCNGVEILAAYVNVLQGPPCCSGVYAAEGWHHDQYSDGWFGVPGFPILFAGQNYWHGINSWYSAGFTYETWMMYSITIGKVRTQYWAYTDITVN